METDFQKFLDELRARVSVAEVVGAKVKLVRKGREYMGLCPFHNEKTPSFTVNEAKGFYHCFGCGAHGDIIKFEMEANGLPFMDAVTKLANKAGLRVPQIHKESPEEVQKRSSWYEITELAAAYFEKNLRLTAGRGTAHQPGRMLALKEGGRTTGVAYRLPEETLEQELTLLWKREMITGCYLPTWCQLDLDDGCTVNAIVFIMDPRHPEYESDTRAQVIAPLIAAASGPLGTNAQYLFSLEQELIKLGMQDDGLNDLLVSVKKLLAENYPDGVLRPGFA